MDAELEARVREYLNGTLEAGERRRLAERLAADPHALSEFVDHLQIDQRLRILLGGEAADPLTAAVLREIRLVDDSPRFTREVVERVKRIRVGRRSWLPWGAVAGFLLVLGLVLFIPADASLGGPFVAAASPGVRVEREGRALPLDPGMALRDGDSIDVPENAFLAIRVATSTRLELGPGRLRLSRTASGHEIHLERGRLDAAGADGRLAFTTPHGSVQGSGAWMTIRTGPASTSLEVEQGSFGFTRRSDGRHLDLAAGQTARIEEGIPFSAAAIRHSALFVVGKRPLEAGDDLVRARMESLNIEVTVRTAREVQASEAAGKDVVVVSSTSRAEEVLDPAGELRNKFRTIPIPVLTWEPRLLFDLGMLPGGENKTDWAATKEHVGLSIVEPAHPLAAGLSGRARVSRTPDQYSWGRPRADALRIATLEEDASAAAIFAYERGAVMPGLVAPARRVAFFLFDATASGLTADGWALFDAALRWCAASGRR